MRVCIRTLSGQRGMYWRQDTWPPGSRRTWAGCLSCLLLLGDLLPRSRLRLASLVRFGELVSLTTSLLQLERLIDFTEEAYDSRCARGPGRP